MHSIKASRQAKVGAVVHDELDCWAEARPEFASFVERLASVAGFVAVLHQRAADGGEFLGGNEYGIGARETVGVEDGVQARREHCAFVVYAFPSITSAPCCKRSEVVDVMA